MSGNGGRRRQVRQRTSKDATYARRLQETGTSSNVNDNEQSAAAAAASPDTHWLIVDDIVTTGHSFIRAVDYLEVEEKPDTITFACMIKRNPVNLDYSAVQGDSEKEQLMVPDERMDFIDKRLVPLYSEE